MDLFCPSSIRPGKRNKCRQSGRKATSSRSRKKGDLSSCSNCRGETLLSILGKVFNRVLLNRMKDAIDPTLGFRKDKSCPDQIAMLCIILEKSLEWTSPLLIIFVNNENAFDSVDRQTLWKLPRHCGVPEKITDVIRNSNEEMTSRAVHGRQLTDAFKVRTGVRQGCLLFLFMFLLTIEWVMKTSVQPRSEMVSSGHSEDSWMTWTLPMTWPFSHTFNNSCGKRPALLQTP